MSNIKKERDEDISYFHYLCKDLHKYIKRRIVKKYVFPQISLYEEVPRYWKYYKGDVEMVTEEDKLCNLFKDNAFLKFVEKFYEYLEIIINVLEKNEKNFEMSKKEIKIGEKKINLLLKVSKQLYEIFNPGADIPLNLKNQFNGKNSQNIISHLSLTKLLNIFKDLKIINAVKDYNNMEDANNNDNSSEIVILHENNINKKNDYIDNDCKIKIKKENFKKEENIINNDIKDEIHLENQLPFEDQNIINTSFKSEPSNSAMKEFKFLSKKTKRNKDINKKSEKYIDIYDSNLINLIGTKISYNRSNNDNNQIIEDGDKYNKKESNSHDENIEVFENQIEEKGNNENIKLNNSLSFDEEYNNYNNNNEIMINNKELGFEKELKRQFSCVFSNENSNKDIIHEIKNILKKIHEIKFPENKNKLENPSIIGTYKHFDTIFLLDSLPAIDILLKHKNIDSVKEINEISKEIIDKNLGLNYIEISKDYDKENGIAKIINRCKIKIKENYFFIYINLFFVNVNISSYIEKEKCINKYMLTNKIYNNKDKILICLFLRRWRRKYKLFFIIPEFLDIIVDFYYNENEEISLIIKHIFYDLINRYINFSTPKGKIIDDDENMNEIKEFIREWFKISNHNEELNKAILSANDYFLNEDYYSLFKID